MMATKPQTKKGIPKSLSATLAAAFLVISIAALLIAGAFHITIHFQTQRKIVAGNQQLIARDAANTVATFIQQKFSIMDTAAFLGYPETASLDERKSILSTLLRLDYSFRNLVYLDPAGRKAFAVSRQSRLLADKHLSRINEALFVRIRQVKRYVSEVYIDEETYEPLVTMTVWIPDIFGDFIGVMAAEVNLKFMWDLVGRLEIGKTGQAYVVDRKGDLIAAKDIARVLRGKNMGHIEEVNRFINTPSSVDKVGANLYRGIAGTRVVGTYIPLGTPDWAVVTELPVTEAYREVIHSIVISATILLVIAAAAAWVGVHVARRLTVPLTNLTETASRITRGETQLFVPLEGPREISVLAGTFNDMTQQLIKMLDLAENRARELRQEIVQREQIKSALRVSEERLDLALTGANDGIWDWRMDSDSFHFDSRYYTMAGYDPDEFPSSLEAWEERIHPDELRQVQSAVAEYISGARQMYDVEFRFQCKNGEYIWVRGKGKIVARDEKGTPTRFDGTHSDITERRRAEEEVRHLRNYLSNIIDSMPSVLVGVDVDGKVTHWNKAAQQCTGIHAATARGNNLTEMFPRMASEMNRIFESIRTRELQQEQKRTCQTEKGIRYEDLTIYPLITNGVEGAVIRIDDVTANVRMEEMMIQSEKMLSIGGLAAGMAHEINNPLAGILQTASVMASRLGAAMDIPASRRAAEAAGTSLESIHRFMMDRGILGQSINESGRRVAGIVDDMLSFARKSDANFSSHLLSDLIDRTIELAAIEYDLKKQYDFKIIQVIREYEEGLPAVPCEVSKIQQVLLNILRNGAQAMLEAGTGSHRFIVRTGIEKARGRVFMEIEDNGPGMDEETRKRLFEPFFTTKPAGVGTGLSLSVSYFIITQNHGGEMRVESRPGNGAKFIIHLPMADGYE